MTAPKITTLEELLTVTKNSPIGFIIESIISQNFVATDKKPLTEKDTVIGTLTPMEKALYDAESSLGSSTPVFLEKLSEIEQEMEAIDLSGADTTALKAKMEKLRNEVNYARKVSRDLIDLYWSFIRQRLHSEGFPDIRNLGIRSDDTIVIPEKRDDEPSGKTLVIRISV